VKTCFSTQLKSEKVERRQINCQKNVWEGPEEDHSIQPNPQSEHVTSY
jgi:hypothetical protein